MPVFIFFNICFIVGFGYQVMSVFEDLQDKSYLRAVVVTVRGRGFSKTQSEEEVSEGTGKLPKPTNIPG